MKIDYNMIIKVIHINYCHVAVWMVLLCTYN